MLDKAKRAPKAPKSRTDWARLRSTTDADIARQISGDPDDAPLLSREEILRQYKPHPPRVKPRTA